MLVWTGVAALLRSTNEGRAVPATAVLSSGLVTVRSRNENHIKDVPLGCFELVID